MEFSPYLNFNGQCEEAFKFYEKCLAGKIEFLLTNGESPLADKTPPELAKEVMHASLRFNGQVIMGADAPPNHYQKPQGFSVAIGLKDVKEAERIFRELSENGT